MATSLFDTTSFLTQTLDQNATRRDPLPAAETYGVITEVDLVSDTVKKEGSKAYGKPWYKLNVKLEITDPAYLALVPTAEGRPAPEKVATTYGIMLDVNDGGNIAAGPNVNVSLGKLREAAGVNEPGKTLLDLKGRVIRIIMGHRPDQNDPSIVYDEVKAVAKYQ